MTAKLPNLFTTRTQFLLIFIVCIALLGFGLYLEHAVGLEPCPLCILQRMAYLLIAAVSLTAAIHRPDEFAGKIYNSAIFLIALAGAATAGRQIWLQHLPPEKVPECGPGLAYMLEIFPFWDTMKIVFAGSGECAEVQWRFIGLSIAEWSIIWFLLICAVSLLAIFYPQSPHRQ